MNKIDSLKVAIFDVIATQDEYKIALNRLEEQKAQLIKQLRAEIEQQKAQQAKAEEQAR